MDAHQDPNLQLVWGDDSPETMHARITCPGTWCECDVPAYYRTRHPRNGALICEDKRLWLEWRSRLAFEQWCYTHTDGTMEQPTPQEITEAQQTTQLDGFARAAREMQERQHAWRSEYQQIVAIAGEPELELFPNEIAAFLNEVTYLIDSWNDAQADPADYFSRKRTCLCCHR